jgi:aspartokinase/homoserine dehydrogenase 1
MSNTLQVNNLASQQTLEVILLGVGGVGRSLLRQLLEQRAQIAAHYGVAVDVLALVDSSALFMAVDGNLLDEATLRHALDVKEQGGKLATIDGAQTVEQPEDALQIMGNRLTARSVVVDCTATDATVPVLLGAVDAGCKIVLANKKPLTVQQEVYNRLTRAGGTAGDSPLALGRMRWETTCGAGLPVILTLNRLQMCGDPVHRIAGALSGTLGFVMSGLQERHALSDVVREAHRLGYTEPDPRDDLGGMDVARKALILARGLGWEMELADVQVEGLYPQAMADLSVADFLDTLPQLDAVFAAQVRAAAAEEGVLRYTAVVEEGRCRVGPTVVPADTPLGRLAGTDNLIEFHTRWYTPAPLIIQGRGAGADVTAAGVLSDIVELGFTH